MKITIDYNSDLPMYEQIEGCVKENIINGGLKHNDPIPSVRQLAKELNVSTITTKRAYMDLEREGLVYTVSGRGTFINNVDVTKLVTENNEKLIEEYKAKTIEMKTAQISKEVITKIVEEIYKD